MIYIAPYMYLGSNIGWNISILMHHLKVFWKTETNLEKNHQP